MKKKTWYKTKVTSKKHINCCNREENKGFNFIITLLIKSNEVEQHLDSGFDLLYKRGSSAIITKHLALSKESIDIFYYFSLINFEQ